MIADDKGDPVQHFLVRIVIKLQSVVSDRKIAWDRPPIPHLGNIVTRLSSDKN